MASIDALRTQLAYVVRDDVSRVDAELLTTFPKKLRAEKAMFPAWEFDGYLCRRRARRWIAGTSRHE